MGRTEYKAAMRILFAGEYRPADIDFLASMRISMPAKIQTYGNGLWVFHCPGCGYDHPFHTDPQHHPTNQSWWWNESLDKPTFTPSLLVFKDDPERRCHSFVTNGRIQFLTDCHHKLAGQTVELPDWEE